MEQFTRLAADTAMVAAGRYFAAVGFDVPDFTAATEVLKRHVAEALPAALADAKDAIDCGLDHVASHTFLASMRLAGIAGAKEIAGQVVS